MCKVKLWLQRGLERENKAGINYQWGIDQYWKLHNQIKRDGYSIRLYFISVTGLSTIAKSKDKYTCPRKIDEHCIISQILKGNLLISRDLHKAFTQIRIDREKIQLVVVD
jgi:hypothetical protein